MNIKKNIFRSYDIRGRYIEEIDEDTAYLIGRGFASTIKNMGKTKCVVGHDNRLSSDSLYNSLIKGITESGIDVIKLGLVTTPMYYYAEIHLGIYSGVMVTASHNPKDDNGFKFSYDESGNCKGDTITDLYEFIIKGEFSNGNGNITSYDISNDYINLFKNHFKFNKKLKVVVDPGNGTTSVIIHDILDLFDHEFIYINDVSDGRFPNHHPDPCVEDNLSMLKEVVLKEGADAGISFDGDGDRLGVITSNGKFIETDKYMILIIRDIINKVSNKSFLYDVKCSKSLEDEIVKLGAIPVEYRTGNSYTKSEVKRLDLPFGGELSGHVYFRDRWPGFDSGIYAGIRLLEILSNTDKNIEELLDGINIYYNTPEIKVSTSDDIKFNIVKSVEEYAKSMGYSYITIDGVKVKFNDSWALVRASKTGPNLTVRFEATTKERLDKIKNEFMELINKLNK